MKWINFLPLTNSTIDPVQVIEFPAFDANGFPLFEAITAVRQIASQYPPPYNLLLSGGIDSQAMLYAWYKSGIPFRSFTARYGNYNVHDIDTMKLFLKNNHMSIDIQYIDIDLVNFYANEHDEYANRYQCSSPQICTHLKILDCIDGGTSVLSGNFITGTKRHNIDLSYAILGTVRYMEITKRPIVPFFFLHTPRLAYSFMKYDDSNIQDGYEAKVNMYTKGGFPVVPQASKLTGFEFIKDLYDNVHIDINHKLKYAGKLSSRKFDLLFRYPYEHKFNDPRIIYKYSFT